jgi:hypothetical protein
MAAPSARATTSYPEHRQPSGPSLATNDSMKRTLHHRIECCSVDQAPTGRPHLACVCLCKQGRHGKAKIADTEGMSDDGNSNSNLERRLCA